MNFVQNEVLGTSGKGSFSFYGSLSKISWKSFFRFLSKITPFRCFSIPLWWVSSWGITSPGKVSKNVDRFSYLNKSTLRISKSFHEKKTKSKKIMLLLLLLGLGAPVITYVPILKKRKTSTWQMQKITHLQKQQRNNKALGHPTIVDVSSYYTTEIMGIS